MATTAIVGGTGLVGSHIVNTLLSLSTVSHIRFLARREPRDPTTESLMVSNPGKLSTFISSDPPAEWASHLESTTPTPEILFSSLATTKANAGGLAPQRALELDANLAIATAAKKAGTKVYVLISATGADKNSIIPYNKMKGEIEESIINLSFEKTIIVRPGMIAGQREVKRPLEGVITGIGNLAGWINKPLLRDWWSQDASEIAKASVNAAMQALKDTDSSKVRYLSAADIIKLGRTEWEEPASLSSPS
ncbi:Protein fmp52, mitochondrial [Myotisia sp. PD_48]|nr:Protein fmp52, mitochondrial [Myotisia sp. PD_48]